MNFTLPWSEPAELSNSEKFGNLIKVARRKVRLTQEQMALRSGTSRFYFLDPKTIEQTWSYLHLEKL